jgi:hypothetical protein
MADLRVVGLVLELGAQPGLGVGLLKRGAPDLVRGKQQHEHTGPDEDPSEDVDDPPQWGHREEVRAAADPDRIADRPTPGR